MSLIRRTPPPPVPFAIIAKVAWGSLRTLRVPEARAVELVAHGWSVLISDSEMENATKPSMDMTLLQIEKDDPA